MLKFILGQKYSTSRSQKIIEKLFNMNLWILIIFQINFILASQFSPISHALHDTINAMFVQNKINFDIIVYGPMTRSIMDVLNEVSALNNGTYAEQIVNLKTLTWDHEVRKSAVILSSDFRYLLIFSDLTKLRNKFYTTFKFLFYYEDSNIHDFLSAQYRKLYWKPGQVDHYSYFLINRDENTFALLSLEWFSEKACNKAQLTVVNDFNKTAIKWQKPLRIEQKFKNFYGCLLTIDVAVKFRHTLIDSARQLSGPIIDIFKGMSVRGNFTPNFQEVEAYYDRNFTTHIAQKLDTKYDLIPNIILYLEHVISSQMFEELHFTTQFHGEIAAFLISSPEPYSAYEKLLLPFDDTTWIFFIAVFLYSFLSIRVINLVSRRFQDMFYGENVKTPAFNVVGTFFGISQTTLPDANFPRILLMTFILYCLILRTAYQSLLFEYVATDMRKASPTTIEDLFEQGFTMYSEQLAFDGTDQMISDEDR
jgi:hypothetical protein